MLLQHNKHIIGHEEHSNNSVKSMLYQEKLREKGVINLNEPQNNLHSNKIQTSLMRAKFEKIGRLVENMRRIKSGLSRKMIHHFWMFACPYTVNK